MATDGVNEAANVTLLAVSEEKIDGVKVVCEPVEKERGKNKEVFSDFIVVGFGKEEGTCF